VLPRRVRCATYVLYAFFRVADDVVDDPDPGPPAEQRRELERMREAAHGRIDGDDAVVTAFHRIADENDVPAAEIDEFVDAMLRDVDGADYETYEDLEAYLRGSSVAVANMMLAVMDPPQADEARPHARALAEAFRSTNFVRDVREDVRDYDRVYLPKATLREHGVTTDDVRALDPTPALRRAVRTELRRTERLYREGVAGIKMLPPDCQFAVLLSATLYAEHHRLIRARDFDVLSGRPSLSTARRLVVPRPDLGRLETVRRPRGRLLPRESRPGDGRRPAGRHGDESWTERRTLGRDPEANPTRARSRRFGRPLEE